MKLVLKLSLLILLPVFTKAQQDPYIENWSNKQIDSLKIELSRTSNDTIRMRISRIMGFHFQEIDRDSSLYFHTQELILARKLKQKLWEADALDQSGWVLSQLKDYPLSLQHFLEGIEILKNQDCEKNIWLISLFAKDKNPATARLTCLGFIYNDISQLYKSIGNYEKELAGLIQAYEIGKGINNYTMLSLISQNMGAAYLKVNKPDSALMYAQEALRDMNTSGYKIYEGHNYTTLGYVYLQKKDYAQARQYFQAAIISNKEQDNKTGTQNAYRSIADLFKALGKYDSSIYFTKKALVGFRDIDLSASINDTYVALYDLYKSTGNTDSAFYYLQLYKTLNDSLTKTDKEKIYEYQNLGFNEQIKMRELNDKRIQRENLIRTYILFSGIVVLMLIAFLLFRNNRIRKKANRLLQEQKEEIEIQKRNVEETLGELKSTQAQLIQSEKMASLGELTAGIAHEIQNPLNFVNNFSDVNKELLQELKEEADKGNMEDVKAIADDVISNSEKINHHGKRADAIVKGMLQHSRKSEGKKKLTDINALCDEYFRLSFHGLRAKDKSFNAEMKTDFDASLPKINVVSQDIGRVILNLINNGFYAVDEKKKQTGDGYEPIVSLSTKKVNDRIEIKVSDNGNGIPEKIKEKIFQPFFTTKPTGSGTGLGLSLSYDIIKAHGGEIKVESTNDEGSVFVILLSL